MTFSSTRRRLHEIIFEADTAAGKAFDLALLVLIVIHDVDALHCEYCGVRMDPDPTDS